MTVRENVETARRVQGGAANRVWGAGARAAGFHASRIDGRELSYNQPDLLMPDILVCPPVLSGPLLDAIRSAQS